MIKVLSFLAAAALIGCSQVPSKRADSVLTVQQIVFEHEYYRHLMMQEVANRGFDVCEFVDDLNKHEATAYLAYKRYKTMSWDEARTQFTASELSFFNRVDLIILILEK